MFWVTALRGAAQKFQLPSVAQTPDAQPEMQPHADTLCADQRLVQRVGLQAAHFLARR